MELRSIKGFTIIEGLIAAAILMVGVFGIMSSIQSLSQLYSDTTDSGTSNELAYSLMETVRQNGPYYLKNYAVGATTTDSILGSADFPLAFTKDNIVDASKCGTEAQCIGMFSYTIRPMASSPSMNEGTLRIYKIKEQTWSDFGFITNEN